MLFTIASLTGYYIGYTFNWKEKMKMSKKLSLVKENRENTRVYIRKDDKERLRYIANYYENEMLYVLKILINKEYSKITKDDNR